MILHFVYAGQPGSGRVDAPYSITDHVYSFLSSKLDVVYHQWDACYDIDLGPDDILLGHPHYDQNTVVQRAFRSDRPARAKCLIHPFHHVRVEDNFPFDELARKADAIFSICGRYWIDSIKETPFAHWEPKIVHLNMAVDLNHFEHYKTTFNPIGSRALLFVGSCMPQKNLGYLAELMNALPDIHLYWYGGYSDYPLAQLPNVTTFGWVQFDKPVLRKICQQSDMFINVSCSDASPTALLEALAMGFPAACTRESGIYNTPMVNGLSLKDASQNPDVIRGVLASPDAILMERSQITRRLMERYHTWDTFCSNLWSGLERFL